MPAIRATASICLFAVLATIYSTTVQTAPPQVSGSAVTHQVRVL